MAERYAWPRVLRAAGRTPLPGGARRRSWGAVIVCAAPPRYCAAATPFAAGSAPRPGEEGVRRRRGGGRARVAATAVAARREVDCVWGCEDGKGCGREGLLASTRGVGTRFAELSPLRQAPGSPPGGPGAGLRCTDVVAEAGGVGGPWRRAFLNEGGTWGGGSWPERGRALGLSWIYSSARRSPPTASGPNTFSGGGVGSAIHIFISSCSGSEANPLLTPTWSCVRWSLVAPTRSRFPGEVLIKSR